MTSNNQSQITLEQKARQLFELVEQRKIIEKAEKQLKSEFKSLAGNGALTLGKFTVVLSEQTRTGIDKKKLVAELGDISRFETKTTFTKLEVKAGV